MAKINGHTKAYKNNALTLVETIIATTVLLIVFIAASGYRYSSTIDVVKSERQTGAVRLCQLLTKSWQGAQGDALYSPVNASFSADTLIAASMKSRPAPDGFTLLGSYRVRFNGIRYVATLAWKDVDTELRALNIEVAWARRRPQMSDISQANKSFTLSTYVAGN
ncbi:MAG: hypothetical protein ACYST9_01480 [Planctomycetota bacterium]|jgi:hypothetical protein